MTILMGICIFELDRKLKFSKTALEKEKAVRNAFGMSENFDILQVGTAFRKVREGVEGKDPKNLSLLTLQNM